MTSACFILALLNPDVASEKLLGLILDNYSSAGLTLGSVHN
jgi:hypothetical protein